MVSSDHMVLINSDSISAFQCLNRQMVSSDCLTLRDLHQDTPVSMPQSADGVFRLQAEDAAYVSDTLFQCLNRQMVSSDDGC